MPPPCATEATFDQSVPPLAPPEPPLEPPAASSAPLSAAAVTASVFLFRAIPLRVRDQRGQDGAIVTGRYEWNLSIKV